MSSGVEAGINCDENEDDVAGLDQANEPEPGVCRSKHINEGKRTTISYHDEYRNTQVEECININVDLNTEKAANVRAFDKDKDSTMLQLSLKTGIRAFKDNGKRAVTKELNQLHNMETFFPVDARELSEQERRDALASLMFLKEK